MVLLLWGFVRLAAVFLFAARCAAAELLLTAEDAAYLAAHPRAYWPRVFEGRRGAWTGLEVRAFTERMLVDFGQLDSSSSRAVRWLLGGGEASTRLVGPLEYYLVVDDDDDDARPDFKVFSGVQRAGSDVGAAARQVEADSLDLVYLSGLGYAALRAALDALWPKVKEGGVIAGADYCDYGDAYFDEARQRRPEVPRTVPRCGDYTDYGVANGFGKGRARNSRGVVLGVSEWAARTGLRVAHNAENWTRASLEADKMSYDLAATPTRAPSWFVIKAANWAPPPKNDERTLLSPRRHDARASSPAMPGGARGGRGGGGGGGGASEPDATSCGAGVREGARGPEPRLVANPTCPARLGAMAAIDARGADLTVAYLYYRDVAYMRRHVAAWTQYAAPVKRRTVFLIVDDGSPEEDGARGVAAAILGETGCSDTRTVVVKVGEDLPWNIGGARNLIFAVAPTELVLSVDSDQLLPQALLDWALGPRFRPTLDNCHVVRGFPRKLETGRPFRVHPGCMLTTKNTYWRVGGCDEDFVGHYGNTDVHFNLRVERTRGCTIQAATARSRAIPAAPPMIYIDDPNKKTDFFGRDTSHNKAIFEAKRDGRQPWARDYLRFSWTTVFDSAAQCTT